MTPLRRLLTMLGVACALPALAVAVAQDAKVKVVPADAPAVAKVYVEAQEKVTPATAPKSSKAAYERAAAKQGDAKPAAAKEQTPAEKKAEYRKAVNGDEAAKPANGDDVVKGRVQGQGARVNAARLAMPTVKLVAPAQAKVAEPNLDPMVAQYIPQFIPLMRTEVHLLLTVTEATPEERKAIVADRQKATKEAAKQYAASQQRIGRFMNTSTYPEPRKLVQESLIAAAKAHLSAEKIAMYQAEIDRRAEDQKSLAIKNIVARMDQDLVLSVDQRDKIAESLSKNWNAAWCQSLETIMYGEQYFPAIPDTVIIPALNPKQVQVWRGTPKNGGMVFGGFNNVFGGMAVDDIFPKDEEPEEKDKEKIDAAQGGANRVIMIRQGVVAETVEVKEVVKEAKAEAKKDEPKEAKKDAKAEANKNDAKPDAPKDAPKTTPKS